MIDTLATVATSTAPTKFCKDCRHILLDSCDERRFTSAVCTHDATKIESISLVTGEVVVDYHFINVKNCKITTQTRPPFAWAMRCDIALCGRDGRLFEAEHQSNESEAAS